MDPGIELQRCLQSLRPPTQRGAQPQGAHFWDWSTRVSVNGASCSGRCGTWTSPFVLGECLGLIGSNGSGRAPSSGVVAGIFMPTEGRAVVPRQVTPMIELGVGFHPDLSGRENVYLNTSLYGLPRRETDDIYDAIVDFSELAEFMDLPVKNYSSGMYVRLGLSVAAHLQPDVLLVDEVLAVGYERFQQKCLARMGAREAARHDGRARLPRHGDRGAHV